MSVCFRAESGERAVNILAQRLDGRRDFPDFVPFSNFLCAWSCTLCLSLCMRVGGAGRGYAK